MHGSITILRAHARRTPETARSRLVAALLSFYHWSRSKTVKVCCQECAEALKEASAAAAASTVHGKD